MDDEEIFQQWSRSSGVEPLDGGSGRAEDGDDEAERQLFLRAMGELEAAGGKPAPPRSHGGGRPSVRRLRKCEKDPRVEEQIDLHRLKAAEALERLEHFVTRAAASGARIVLVITGKGHHSPNGRGVLRQRVEEWLRGPDRSRVRAFSEAPRKLGGRGAFVLYLR